jgi:hypothetical protein
MPELVNRKTAQRRRLSKITSFELGRPKARLGNPNTGIPEFLVQPVYDIYFAAAGQALALLTLFSLQQNAVYNFMGVTGFAKTFDHTNLVQAGMLDSSYSFIIRGLSVDISPLQGAAHPYLNHEDAINFLNSFVELDVNRKPYFQGKSMWLPGGGGPVFGGFGTLTAASAAATTTNGVAYAKNIYSLPGGIAINPQENFAFIINPTLSAGGAPTLLATVAPSAGIPAAGLSVWVRLDGTFIRVA